MSKLFIISGPSGAGKGTLVNMIMEKYKDIFLSISMTTRQPRLGEKEGVNYYYITVDEFKKRIEEDKMLEYAEYCGTFYGTPREPAEKALNDGNSMILEIEVEGMRQVKAKMPDAVTIFIAPPSIDDLAKRIKKRDPNEKDEVIEKRVARAQAEMEFTAEYDHMVINDDLEDAFTELSAIIAKYIRD